MSAIAQRKSLLLNINDWKHYSIPAGLFAVCVFTVLCYWPSLSGPFVFDDVPNLEALGERGGLDSSDKYIEFITGGRSGPLGRPLSLASFTLDGTDWPTDPKPFRITNLLLHLLTGVLVFVLAQRLLVMRESPAVAARLALLCAAIWLLHPLLVSTTAYVVQRMTQLSVLFTLAGLITYMHGRIVLQHNVRRGWLIIIGGMGLFGLLAILSKETGIVLPLLALLIEVTVFSATGLPRKRRAALLGLLAAPLLAVLAYFVVRWEQITQGFIYRPYDLSERLLTQAVILVDYLRQSIAPQLSGLGIFHDDYPISDGLLSPPMTLVSIAIIIGLIVLAVRIRKSYALVSLGILWFFAGHLLEAGPIPLELYFEHRNYLPLFGPIIAIVSLLPKVAPQMGKALLVVIALVLALQSFLTWQAATTWSSEERLMHTTLVEHPESLRAAQYLANQLIMQGQYDGALRIQRKIAERYPDSVATELSIINLQCLLGTLKQDELQTVVAGLHRGRFDLQVIGYLSPFITMAEAKRCASIDHAAVAAIFDALLRNPVMNMNGQMRGAIQYHSGLLLQLTGDLDAALSRMDAAFAADPDVEILLRQTVWTLDAGRADAAQRYLDLARQHASGREDDLQVLQQRIIALRGGSQK